MQLDPSLSGSWAEYIVVNSKTCCVLNQELDFIKGSAMMINPLMVLYMSECIKKGKHKVVINTLGASTIGKMLIRWCHYSGITLINVVSREDQEEIIRGIAADYIVKLGDHDFDQKLKNLCQEVKPTCAFDPFGGEIAGKVFNCLEKDGEMFLYGEHGKTPLCGIPSDEFISNKKSIKGLNLFEWYESHSLVKRYKLLQKIQKLHYVFRTEFTSVLPFSLFQDAINLTKSIHSSNKVLLHIGAKENATPRLSKDHDKENVEISLLLDQNKSNSDRPIRQELPRQASIIEAGDFDIQIVKEGEIEFSKPESIEIEDSPRSELESEDERLDQTIKEYEDPNVTRMMTQLSPFEYDYDLNDGIEVFEKSLQMMPDFSVHKGEWANHACHGKGVRYYYDGSIYEGYWKNGRQSGKGRFFKSNGEIYQGFWEESLRHGLGKLSLQTGTVYEGEFIHDKFLSGTQTSPNGQKYSGTFKDNLFQGEGTLVLPDGLKYQGNFEKGEIDGDGKLYYIDGKRFEGSFKGLNAEGIMYYTDGSKYLGSIVSGKEDGEGIFMDASNHSKQGVWKEGLVVSWLEE